jgi:hypothetical protein
MRTCSGKVDNLSSFAPCRPGEAALFLHYALNQFTPHFSPKPNNEMRGRRGGAHGGTDLSSLVRRVDRAGNVLFYRRKRRGEEQRRDDDSALFSALLSANSMFSCEEFSRKGAKIQQDYNLSG